MGAAIRAEGDVVVELSRDREDGVEVWEVGVLRADGSGGELYLDVQTGEVLRERALDLDSEQRSAPAVSARDAIAVALCERSCRPPRRRRRPPDDWRGSQCSPVWMREVGATQSDGSGRGMKLAKRYCAYALTLIAWRPPTISTGIR